MIKQPESELKTLNMRILGDILSTSVEKVREEVQAGVDGAARAGMEWKLLELDLTDATMIDSAGLNLIVSFIRMADRHGGKVKVWLKHSGVHRTMLFTRLDQHLELVKV